MCAAIEPAMLMPNVPLRVATGLALEIPAGYEVQLRPRSGLALKYAITLPNSPATIDPGYRGELKVILMNLGKAPYEVQEGDRVAQIVVAKYETVTWDEGELARFNPGRGWIWIVGPLGTMLRFRGETAGEGLRLAGVLIACLLVIGNRDGRGKLLERERADTHAGVKRNRHDAQIAQFESGFAAPAGIEQTGGAVHDDADAAQAGTAFKTAENVVV